MNTIQKLSIASAFMLTAAFGMAHAQQANDSPAATDMSQADDGPRGDGDRGGRHHGRHGGHEGRGGKGMRIIDANNDGVIGEDEAAALADGAFMQLDQDRDGKVSEAEFLAGPGGHKGWFNWNSDETAAVQKIRTDKFAVLDVNKDKSLNKAEFFADAKAKLAAADADMDGKVTPWEFRANR
jgi:hypothetical protein